MTEAVRAESLEHVLERCRLADARLAADQHRMLARQQQAGQEGETHRVDGRYEVVYSALLDEELAVRQQVVPLDKVARDRVQEEVEDRLARRRQVDAVLDVRLERLAHQLVELARQAVQVALEVALLVDDVVIFGIVLALHTHRVKQSH